MGLRASSVCVFGFRGSGVLGLACRGLGFGGFGAFGLGCRGFGLRV